MTQVQIFLIFLTVDILDCVLIYVIRICRRVRKTVKMFSRMPLLNIFNLQMSYVQPYRSRPLSLHITHTQIIEPRKLPTYKFIRHFEQEIQSEINVSI